MTGFSRTFFVIWLSLMAGVLALGVFVATAFAEPSYTMNYQGKLTTNTGATVANGTYQLVFKLYTAPTGGAAIWTETRSAGNKVTVTNGLFSVMLGSLTSLSSVNFNQPLYLGVTVESDSEMTPRKIIGTVPSAFEAKKLGGVASSSFLRNDVANSASSLLTFNGGLLSSASSTIARLSFLNATGTSLYLGGDRITDFTGSNLTVTAGALGLSSSYAGQTSITTLGTISAGTWQGTAIASTYLDTAVILSTEIDTSSELAAILGDETGSGSVVFSASPTFTGAATFNGATLTTATTTNLVVNGERFTDLTGTGLVFSGNSLTASLGTDITAAEIANGDHGDFTYSSGSATLDNNVVTPNKVKSTGQTDEYCLTYEATGTTWEWQTCAAGGGSFTTLSDVSIASLTGYRIPFTNAAGTAIVDDSGFLFNGTTDVLTVGTATFAGSGFSFSGNATTSIKNNSAYAFTFATSSTARPLFRIDTTTGGETVQIGAVGGDVYIGGVGSASNLIFEESSTISGQGGNRITLGVAGDKINFGTGINVGFGTTTPNQAIGIFRSAADSAIEFSSASGSTYKWSMGIDYSDGAKFKISSSSVLGTNDRLVIAGNGYVGIGTSSPAFPLDVTGTINSATGFRIAGTGASGANYLSQFTTTASQTYLDYTGGLHIRNKPSLAGAATETFTILSGGAVGIGTTTPGSSGEKLSVYHGSDSYANFVDGGGRIVTIGTVASSNQGFVGTQSAHSFSIRTSNSPRLTVTSAGNVGIASTSPWQELSVTGDFVLTGRIYDSLASAGTNGMILQTTGSATRWVATSSLNLAASAIANDSLDFAQFQDTLDLDANTTINGDDDVSQFGLTMSSDLSVAARSTALLTLTQPSNVTNDFDSSTTGLLNITNDDVASDATLIYLRQNSTVSGASNINIYAPGTNRYGIRFVNNSFSGTGIDFGSISSGTGINADVSNIVGGSAIAFGGTSAGSFSAFTGDGILINPSRIKNSIADTLTDTGNLLDISPAYTVNVSGATFNITGDLATLSSTLTETLGTITDSRNILSLAQNCGTNADCTGSVLELTNAGTGNSGDFFMTNTVGTQTNGLYLRRNGSGGTTSNGLNIASDAGTLTTALLIADGAGTIGTGIQLTGTFSTNLLDTPSLDISAAGAITGATGITSTGLTSVANLIASASSTISRATFVTATTTNLVVNGERFTDLTGSGLAFSSNALTVSLANDYVTPNMVKSAGQTDEFCLTYETTGTTWEWQTCGSSLPSGAAGQFLFYASAGSSPTATYTAYASSTNAATIFGSGAGGQNATTSATLRYLTAFGYQALKANTTGTSNVGLGALTLAANTTGSNNTVLGYQALLTATSTSNAVAVGYQALKSLITSGTSVANTAVGYGALTNNTYGGYNTALGFQTLSSNTTGLNNTALGSNLTSNTTGSNNTAVGQGAISIATSTSNTVAIGYNALSALRTSGASIENTAVGFFSLFSNTYGGRNTALGFATGDAITTGSYNSMLGSNALGALTTGSNNTALGYQSLLVATTTSNTVAVGYQTLAALITSAASVENTAIGYQALTVNTYGGRNTGVGYNVLLANTTGSYNSAFGDAALGGNTTGTNNSALGYQALLVNTTGANNVAIGYQAFDNATTTSNTVAIGSGALGALITSGISVQNTAIGYQALTLNTYGGNNTAVGFATLDANTTGSNNIALGGNALGANTTGNFNVSLGYNSSLTNITGSGNIAIGFTALNVATSTSNTIAIGYNSLNNLISSGASVENIAIGYQALTLNTYGGRNTAVGYQVLDANTTGSYNSAFGDAALGANTTGGSNVAIGYQGLLANTTGGFNTVFGNLALSTATSTGSTVAIGHGALSSLRTSGASIENTAIGYLALTSATYGGRNTAVGYSALDANTTGSYNSAFGDDALGAVNTGSNNIALGYRAGDAITSGSNNIIIGYDIDNISASASNRLNIGNLLFGTGLDGTGTTLSTGNIGISTTTPNQKLTIMRNTAASTNDAAIELSGASGSTYKWTMGMDFSDAGKFKISSSSALGTNDRFVIDGSGRIGVGNASPQAMIDVNLGGTYGTRINDGSIQFGVPVDATWNATIGFQNYGGADSFFIRTYGGTVMTADDQGGGVYLWSNGTRRFTVANNGNVGIGTTTPNQKLSIFASAADSAIEFSSLTGSPYKWTAGIDYSDAGKFKISSSSALGTNDRFTIDGAGKVGINTTTPGAQLAVTSAAAAQKGLLVKGAVYQTDNILAVQDSGGNAIFSVNGTTTSAVAATRTFSGTEDLRTTLSSFAGITSGSVNRTSAIIGETRIGTTNNNLNYGISGTAGAYSGVGNAAAIQAYTFAIGGTTTSAYTYFAATPFTSSGFITNQYGLYIADQSYTGVTNAWGIYEAGANNNYFAGNVGIGDTTPSSLFTVGNGDLFTINTSGVITSSNNITPNSVKTVGQTDEYCLTYESTGTTWEWQTCGGGGSLFTDGGATTYLTASTDNLGLGTSTANQALSIFRNGADAAVEFSTISGANEKWTVGIDDSDGAKFKISSSSALGTNDRFVINGNGDVGIGTASHDNQYKLAVRGDNTTSVVRFSMDAGGNSSTYNRFVGFTNQAFSLQYATMNVSSNAFQIQSNTNFDLKLDAVGSADDVLLQSVGTGKVGIGTSTPNRKLTVYNSTANSGVIGFENPSGAASIGTDTLGGFMQAGTANKGVWLYDNAATGFIGINGVSHKIGIGTTTPAATLDVYDGAIRAIADSTYQTVGYGKGLEMRYRTDSGLDNAEILSYDRSGGSSKGLLVAGSELRFDTPTNGLGWTLPDMTLTAAGNLGIGTTTPSAKLDVYNGVLRATGNGAVPTFGQGLEVGYVSGTYGQINSYNRSTSAFTQLRIDGLTTLINSGSGGNVGIGTTTASEKLSIYGNLLLTSTGRIYMPNNASIYARNAANSFYAPILALDSSNQLNLGETTASLATPIRFFTTGSATPNAVLTTGGNLGIGTTTPNQKLTVEGNLNLSSAIGAIYFDDTKYIYASSTNDSIVFGESAGAALTTTGLNNVVIGYQAMQVATTSDYMVAVGYQALKSLINSGASVGNTAVGYQTLSTNTYGGYNSSFGYQALFSNTTGSFNSASGFQSQYSNTTGAGNSSFGRSSLQSNTTGSNNTVFGTIAFNIATSTSNTVAVGYAALGSLITSGASVENTAIGYQTLTANTYGGRNTAVGHQSLFSNTTGSYNTAVGDYPLYGNTTGSHNIAIGYRALLNATTTSNTVAIGRNALENLRTAGVTVGNTAIGYLSQNGNYYGGQNTSLGYQALWQNYDGSKNTAVGNGALGGVSFNASNNTVFGYQAGDNITTGASNIIIGTDIDAISATASNRLNIGNLLFGTGIDGTGGTLSSGNIGIGTSTPNTKLYVLANSASTYSATFDNDGNNANRSGILVQAGLDDHTAAGPSTLIGFKDGDGTTVGSITFGASVTAYNTTSDVRLKTNIVETAVGITQLMQVKVRDFNWKADADKSTLTTGFIAQELAQIYPQAVTIPKNLNDIWMVDYSKLMPLVIAGVQDQQVTVTEQGTTLGTLGEQLLATIQSVGDLEAAVSGGLSENYHTEDETIEAGELVALATTSDATIRRAHTGDEIFGVVSENAGIVLGDGMSSAKPVALTGRVAVKVNDEGGDIEIGDAITISTEDGIGTKATTTTRVIGTALEASDDDTDTIHIYVSPQLHYAWNETAAVASLFTPIDNDEDDTLWGRITTLASNFVDGVLSVAGIKTDELCVGDVCVDEATFLKMVQDAGGSGQSNNNGGDNTGGGEVPPEPEPSPEPGPTPPLESGPELGPIAPEEPAQEPEPTPEAPIATVPEGGTL